MKGNQTVMKSVRTEESSLLRKQTGGAPGLGRSGNRTCGCIFQPSSEGCVFVVQAKSVSFKV